MQHTVGLALNVHEQSRQSHTDLSTNQDDLGNPSIETPLVTLYGQTGKAKQDRYEAMDGTFWPSL